VKQIISSILVGLIVFCTTSTFGLTITGTNKVCVGYTTALSGSASGGTWSSSNGSVATVNVTTGVVTGVAPGNVTVTYKISPSNKTTISVTVYGMPSAITDTANVCAGLATTLSDATSGGIWTSEATGIATIGSSSGLVNGILAGTSNITYTLVAGCTATKTVTVNALPAAITGAASLCTGLTTAFTDATAGGTWSCGNTLIATIVSTTGIATAVAAGTGIITYKLSTGCTDTLVITTKASPASIAGDADICAGGTSTLSDGTSGGTWSSASTGIATIGSANGIMAGIAAGTTDITYKVSNGCFAAKTATIDPLPSAISGAGSVCAGSSIALSDAAGGAWTSSNTTIATIGSTGAVTGVAAGTANITYTSGAGCIATKTITVNALPSAISGTAIVCAGLTTTLSDPSAGGSWSSASTVIATIGSGTGVASGLAAGTSTISYTLSTGCAATKTVTINALPSSISGTASVCAGATTTLTDATAGGIWTSGATGIATVASGLVTGIAAGTATITYALGTGCITIKTVTVNAVPSAITGTAVFCAGSAATLSDPTTGGLWTSAATTIARIGSATGVATGISAGTAIVSYTLGTGCTAVKAVTVNALPAAITGSTNICVGSASTLNETTGGGTWASSNTAIVTVNTTGLITGIAAGTARISYTLASGCLTTTTIAVISTPSSITGSGSVCASETTSLSDAGGGAWSSSNTAIATVGISTGIVTGVSAGTADITYGLGSGCLVATTVTVNVMPSVIAGTNNVCAGLTIALTDTTSGGNWISSNSTIASVDANGSVTGLAVGTATITYAFGSGCVAKQVITVNAVPDAITGTDSVCQWATTALTSTPGGIWSNDNTAVAIIDSTGIVTGVAAGTTMITYILATGCMANTTVTVNTLPAPISGAASICAGTMNALSDDGGGTWSACNTSVACVGTCTGMVMAVTPGTTTISYTLGTGCTATQVVTVYPLPAPICGATSVCAGSAINLADSISGGKWSSGSTTVATVNQTTGVVTGKAAGLASISYTLNSGCGMATRIVTINPVPSAVSGASGLCIGLTAVFGDASAGGTWSSFDTSIATIDDTGLVTGLVPGTSTITYANSVGCLSTKKLTVNPLPSDITGPDSLCTGASLTLSDAGGGRWNTANTTVASIGAGTGTLKGITAGTACVTYRLSTGCITTTTITVSPMPLPMVGVFTVCSGLTTAASDSTYGGNWSVSDISIAAIDGAGVITGYLAGTTTITYALGTGCAVTKKLTVNPLPSDITGPDSVCAGSAITLSDAGGGRWSSADVTVATAGAGSGLVKGVAAGVVSITYKLSTGCITTTTVTVNPLPSPIIGLTSVCAGSAVSLSDSTNGGTWSISDSTVAAIDSTGIVTGITANAATVTYTINSGCWLAKKITVNPLPMAITGVDSVCPGATVALADSGRGRWSTANTAVATIGASNGIVKGVSTGTAIITYKFSTGCMVTKTETVNDFLSGITGKSSVCAGLTTDLSDTGTGAWSIGDPTIATIDSTGLVSAITAGSTTVTYTMNTGCMATQKIIVNPLPSDITGISDVCVGASVILSDAGGGKWYSGNTSVATVGITTRIVTGMSAGTTTITYALGTGCLTTTTVTVDSLPSAIAGIANVCAGLTTSLSDAGGGDWTSADPTVAAVDITTGIVTGIAAGAANITYTLDNGCIAKLKVTVNPSPSDITGADSVCVGATITLSDAGGGKWYSSNTSVAAIGSTSRIVTGISGGTAVITYTLATGCTATTTLTVNTLPSAITGNPTLCAGTVTALSDSGAGYWMSGNTAVATVDSATGIVTGIAAGSSNITYMISNGCAAKQKITVNPAAQTITGSSTVCAGSKITLSDPGNGKWTSSNTAIATVSSSRQVSGIAPGTTTITYTLATGCMATADITVNDCSANPIPDTTTGVGSVIAGNNTLQVYPNPNQGDFNVRVSSSTDEHAVMYITNVVGQKVLELSFMTNRPVPVALNSAQTPGIYLVTVITANGRYEEKVMVTR
jgi:trimeric autotransporter adhesin